MPDMLDDLHQQRLPAPVVLDRADVPPDTWAGLLADGHYRWLTDRYALRADVTEDVEHRARALPGPLPAKAVVARRSAAWVHVGGQAPARLDLVVPPGRRVDPHVDRCCTEAPLGPTDVVMLGGYPVTSPTRTLFDLVFAPGAGAWWPVLVALCDTGADAGHALAAVGRQRGARQARGLLRDLAEPGFTP
ncbi:MAG: type IV toxin-antitoxin system AbiEi family antitoxin [Micrococcales bacterium]|nr:type IV toxin-antitoxin system AbiEi family antitoxin [Micrococcales bacterium]